MAKQAQIGQGRTILAGARDTGLGINCYGGALGAIALKVKHNDLDADAIRRQLDEITIQPSWCRYGKEPEARTFPSPERVASAVREFPDFIYIDHEGRIRIK